MQFIELNELDIHIYFDRSIEREREREREREKCLENKGMCMKKWGIKRLLEVEWT